MGKFQFSLRSLEVYYDNKKKKVLEETRPIFKKMSENQRVLSNIKKYREELNDASVDNLQNQIELRKNYFHLLENSKRLEDVLSKPFKEAQMKFSRVLQQQKSLELLKQKEKELYLQSESRKERLETEEFNSRAFYGDLPKERS